jgi:hypothetical protein
MASSAGPGELGGAESDLAGIDDFSAAQHARGSGRDLGAPLAGRDPARGRPARPPCA